MNRETLQTISAALELAIEHCDSKALDMAKLGDREALSGTETGTERAEHAHALAKRWRDQASEYVRALIEVQTAIRG